MLLKSANHKIVTNTFLVEFKFISKEGGDHYAEMIITSIAKASFYITKFVLFSQRNGKVILDFGSSVINSSVEYSVEPDERVVFEFQVDEVEEYALDISWNFKSLED